MASSTTLGVKLSAELKEQLHQAAASVDRTPHWVIKQLIGAVVGVQPFGREGLPGTGPKAGGPLYLPCGQIVRTFLLRSPLYCPWEPKAYFKPMAQLKTAGKNCGAVSINTAAAGGNANLMTIS